MIKKSLKYSAAAAVLATMIHTTPAFANPAVTPVTKGQIDATKGQVNDLETKVQQLDNRIILSMENSQNLNEQIGKQQVKIKDTEAEIEKSAIDLENHKNIYSERLKSIQSKGNQTFVSYAELLISSNSVSEFFNRFTAISQFIQSDTELLNGLKEKEETLKEAEAQLHSQIDQLKKNQVELAAEQKQIEEDKKAIERELASVKDTLQNQQAQMAQQQEAARQAQLAQQLAEQARQQTQQKAAPSSSSSKPSTVPVSVAASASAELVIATAKQYLGVPYVWGGSTPSGFDCSGFVGYVYRSVGISLPRTSRDQQRVGTRISLNEVQPGDLVFRGNPAYHVGIYIGGGQFIHAPQTGDVVKIAPFNPSSFTNATRILR